MLSLLSSLFVGVSDFEHASAARRPIVGPFIGGEYYWITRDVLIFCFTLAVAHLAVVTSLGLSYCDRMRQKCFGKVSPQA